MSPNIQSAEMFKAIEIAIPAEAIEQAIASALTAEAVSLKPKSKRSDYARYQHNWWFV
ncbi:hypothetical protein [Scytonema sp. UIC 10036]|uniref:hypothetical protein n=1 Tax=Scytonema sp. UIC 10036 TaxID=2304196 RepID=UPI001FAAAF86|nr:hypothetical protein [Scytonema sp. UIC 10036]